MRSSLKPLAVGACVSALAATFLIGSAAASPLPTLVLSIQDERTLIVPDTKTVGCDEFPDRTTGSHPRREHVCSVLEKSAGDFSKVEPVPGRVCTLIYDPVTVTAKGRYHGKRVDFEAIFANACQAAAMTDDIFHW